MAQIDVTTGPLFAQRSAQGMPLMDGTQARTLSLATTATAARLQESGSDWVTSGPTVIAVKATGRVAFSLGDTPDAGADATIVLEDETLWLAVPATTRLSGVDG